MASRTRTNTTDQTAQPPRYLRVTEERSNGYFHLIATVRTQKYDPLDSQYMPGWVDDEYDSGQLLSGLQLRAQGDSDSQLRGLTSGENSGAVYGWDIEYHEPYRVDRRKVARMHKTLETLHKRLERISDTRGRATSFGEYCGRLAEALGCSGIVTETKPRSGEYRTRWDWQSIGDGVNRVNWKIQQWQREALPAALPAAEPATEPAAAAEPAAAGREAV